ncbi:uncharacterized protein [Amphiura filiformis]|uniref:uncharacterized protein n=1 Tax=Amphiura filiformis TaxID=82378 RepID=UPI003B21A311
MSSSMWRKPGDESDSDSSDNSPQSEDGDKSDTLDLFGDTEMQNSLNDIQINDAPSNSSGGIEEEDVHADDTPNSTFNSRGTDNNSRGTCSETGSTVTSTTTERSPAGVGNNNDINRGAKDGTIENFVRVKRALVEVTLKAAPCVEAVVKQWHHLVKPVIGSCETPEVCRKLDTKQSGPTMEKKGYCDNCLLWVDSVKAAINQYSSGKKKININWENLILFEFHKDPLQIAKAFVFKIPKDKLKKFHQMASFDEFDEGSLLLVIKNFGPLLVCKERREHQVQQILKDDSVCCGSWEKLEKIVTKLNPEPEDKEKQEEYGKIIQQAFEIRCDLDHLAVRHQLKVDSTELETYFKQIEAFVNLMIDLGHFTEVEANTLSDELKEIRSMTITEAMIKELKTELQRGGRGDVYIIQNYYANGSKAAAETESATNEVEELPQGADAMPSNLAYNMLKRNLKKRISKADVVDMKTLLEIDTGIHQKRIDAIHDVDSLIKCLESFKLFNCNNLVFITMILTLQYGEDDDSVEHVKKYGKAIQERQPLCIRYVKRDPDNEYVFVELKIEGDVKHFLQQDVEKYREKLVQMLGLKPQQVRFAALNEGCIVVVFLIPPESAKDMITANKNNSSWLTEMNIFGVQVEGEEYISVQDVKAGPLLASHKELDEAESEERQKEEEAKKKQVEEKKTQEGRTSEEETKTDSQESHEEVGKETTDESCKAGDGTNIDVDKTSRDHGDDASKGSEPAAEVTASSAPLTSVKDDDVKGVDMETDADAVETKTEGASTKPEEKPQAAAADCDVCEHLHYPMKNKPHGLCVIINNGDIIPGKAVTGLHIKDRTENAADTKKLKCLFEKLDYKVEVHTNLTSSAMYEVLDSKRQTDHSKFDAFICFILGYGSKSELYGGDVTPISLSKLIQLFIPVVCPSLEGKPKLFFIKPCGVTKTQELYDIPTIPIHDRDFFISYAALPGLSEDAMCTDQGSVYIQSLVETISESYSKLDVQYMSNLVHMNMFPKRDEQGHKQVAASFSTMTKMMYLCRNPVVAIEKYQTAVDATHLCHTPPMTSAKEREEQIIRPEIEFHALPLQYISNLVHMNRFPKRDEQGRKQVAASFSTMILYIGGNPVVARVIQNAGKYIDH